MALFSCSVTHAVVPSESNAMFSGSISTARFPALGPKERNDSEFTTSSTSSSAKPTSATSKVSRSMTLIVPGGSVW